MAEAADVSIAAASVALRGRPGVSDKTRARVERVARKLGYIPDAAAASLRSGRTGLAVFVSDATDHPVIPALAAQAVAAHFLLVVAPPDAVRFLLGRDVDAAVVCGSDKAASAWARSGRPLVVIGPGRLPRGALRIDDGDDPSALAAAAIEGMFGLVAR